MGLGFCSMLVVATTTLNLIPLPFSHATHRETERRQHSQAMSDQGMPQACESGSTGAGGMPPAAAQQQQQQQQQGGFAGSHLPAGGGGEGSAATGGMAFPAISGSSLRVLGLQHLQPAAATAGSLAGSSLDSSRQMHQNDAGVAGGGGGGMVMGAEMSGMHHLAVQRECILLLGRLLILPTCMPARRHWPL